MANTYFKFKQFTIHQDACAMKVCTDACILGAWFASKVPHYASVLDIGSGTGLLMMMLAQQSQSEIHGIELDLPAFKQLKANVAQNKWQSRLKVFPGDARSFAFPVKYDFIITNPPFFENDLLSRDDGEQLAKHSKQLRLEELINTIDRNLSPAGSFGILLPFHRRDYFDELARQHGFHLTESLHVKQTPGHAHFRAILHYSRCKENTSHSHELTIQQDGGKYTEEFTELLKAYYLYL